MSNNVSKRTYLHLDFVQGEDIILEFDVMEDCERLYLDDYTLTGSIIEDYNGVAITNFSFAETDEDPEIWAASIPSSVTSNLLAQTYKYEIKMMNNITSKTETLLYGTLTLSQTRIS
jgi:nitrogen regulatory protein PII-like uncharacterized protein